jgi:hypothetical protein
MFAFLAAGCVSPHSSPSNSPVFAGADSLDFKVTGFPGIHSVEYQLRTDGILTEKTEEWNGGLWHKKQTRYYRIRADALHSFNQEIAKLQLSHWKRTYAPPPSEMILDGYGWTLHWQHGGQIVESTGSNAGPNPMNPRKAFTGLTGPKSADVFLGEALARLAAHSDRICLW